MKSFINYINEHTDNLALLITIPKSIKWEDYLKEIDAVKDGKQQMNYKVPTLPVKVHKGSRCYICHNGFIKGWMMITDIFKSDGFTCTTTGEQWDPGFYIARSGEFHKCDPEVPQKGFMGYKYIEAF